MVPIRDRVKLATNICRQEDAAPTPVLVACTPHDKDGIFAGGDTFNVLRAVQEGYTMVPQDIRGRYISAGMFNPLRQETADGLDTFAWAAAQTWPNGVVKPRTESAVGVHEPPETDLDRFLCVIRFDTKEKF